MIYDMQIDYTVNLFILNLCGKQVLNSNAEIT